MAPQQLWLISKHWADQIIHVAKARSTRATTLRRDRAQAVTLRVPARGKIDVISALGVKTKAEAIEILDASSEFASRFPDLMCLVDPEEAAKKRTEKLANTKKSEEARAIREAALEEARKIETERAKRELEALTRRMFQDARMDRPRPLIQKQEEPVEDKQVAMVPDDPKDVIPDNIPSTRWDRARLAEYAATRGLTITDEMSKNAILRALREKKL